MGKKMLKYMKLFHELQEQILNGTLAPGDRLESEPKLGEQYGVSRQTVRQAIALLEKEGMVNRIQGSGTYIRPMERLRRRAHTKTIALVVTSENEYILPPIISGISSTLMNAGYTTNLYITNNSRENERRILREILDNPPDGLLLEPSRNAVFQCNSDLYREIEERLPCVLLHSEFPGRNLPCISPDNVRTAERAIQYLHERGHRHIGGIFKSDDYAAHLRFVGYAAGLRRCGLPLDESCVTWYTTESIDYLYDGSYGNYLYQLLQTCTAMVCFNDEIAVRLYQFARRRNIVVPRDLSLISFDDSNLNNRMEFPISSYIHPKEKLGIKAAENLLQRIENPEFDANYKFQLDLAERDSVRTLR